MQSLVVLRAAGLGPDGSGRSSASGLIVELDGEWFLLTAEHYFAGHDGDPKLGVDHWKNNPNAQLRIAPYAGSDRTDLLWREGIVWTFPGDERITGAKLAKHATGDHRDHWRQSDLFAAILPFTVVEQLKRFGVTPLTGSTISDVAENELPAFAAAQDSLRVLIFGAPETRKALVNATTESIFLGGFPVQLAPEQEHALYQTWLPAWDYAHPDETDLRGASGGPVVALGGPEPRLIGIQVSQISGGRRRYHSVTPMPLFEVLRAVAGTISSSSSPVIGPRGGKIGPKRLSTLG